MTLENKTTKTQCSQILEHLKTGKGLTQKEAFELIGSYRLASRIYDLHKKGHNITFVRERVKNRHGRYTYINRYFLAEFQPENAVPVEPKISAARKRLDAAWDKLSTCGFYASADYSDASYEALEIAAGLK